MYFEYKLPDIFENLNLIYKKSTNDEEKVQFKEKVLRILKIWNDWAVYDLKYLFGLEASLVRDKNLFCNIFKNFTWF